MPFNLTPEPVDTGYDLTAAKPPVAPLEKEKLEERVVKYHMALGDASPGLGQIETMLQSPGGDENLRQAAVVDEANKRRQAAIDVFKSGTASPETMAAAAEASRQPVNPESVIERRYAESLFNTSLSLTKNPEEVSQGFGDVSQKTYDWLVELQTKQEGFNKIKEDIQAQRNDRTWGAAALDFVPTLFPFYSEATMRQDEALGKDMGISFLPGATREQTYAYIRSLPPDQAIATAKAVVAEISSHNVSLADEWITGLTEGYSASDAGLSNFFTGLDAAGLVPTSLIVKGGKDAVKAAEKATAGYVAAKEALNHVPTDAERLTQGWRIVTETGQETDAQKLAKGWTIGEYTDSPIKAVENRLIRTKVAAAEPGAKVDNILAATGHVEEAQSIMGLEFAEKFAPGASKTMKQEVADLTRMTPSIASPKQWFTDTMGAHVKNAGAIAERLTQNVDLFTQMAQVVRTARLPAEARVIALDEAVTQLQKEFHQRGIKDAVVQAINKFDNGSSGLNIGYVEAILGKKGGGFFNNPVTAKSVAENKYGFKPGEYLVTQEGDTYAIRVRADIDETSEPVRQALLKGGGANVERNKILGIIPVPKVITGARQLTSEEQAAQRITTTVAATALEKYAKAMVEPVQALSKRERAALEKVMQKGRTTYRTPGDPNSMGKFYNTIAEFEEEYVKTVGRLPTDNEAMAYAVMVQQNDMDYIFRASNELVYKSRLGYGRMTTTVGGKPVTFEGKYVDRIPASGAHDAGIWYNGKMYYLKDAGVEDFLAKEIKDRELKVVQIYNPEQNAFKEAAQAPGVVNFVVTGDAKKAALRMSEQLPYRPGGHVKYKDPLYITQAKFSWTGKRKTFAGEKVFLGVSNDAKGMRELQLIEKARQAIKAGDDNALRSVIAEGLPFEPGELKKMFKETFDVDTPFTLRPHGQKATSTLARTVNGKTLRESVGDFEDLVDNPFNDARKVSQDFIGERNSPMYSIADATEDNPAHVIDAPMVDVYETQAEAMGRLIRSRHFNDYQIGSAEQWAAEFHDLITLNGQPVSKTDVMRNPMYFLTHGQINKNISRLDARAATAAASQAAINNLLRHSSPLSTSISHLKSKIVAKAYEKSGEKFSRALDDKLTWMNVDLPTKFRAVAFHTKMGLFNVAQFPLQLQTMAIITALNPKHGLSAAHVGAWMARLHLTGDDPRVLNQWSKWAAKITPGWTPEQFAESFRALRKTGFDIVGREQSYRNDLTDPKLFNSTLGSILDFGTKPFTAAERWVRLAAWNTAYKDYIEKFPRLAGRLTDQDIRTILTKADDYSLNMTRAGHARWQEGDFSMMTQFWGYSMRMFDLLTGNKFTGMQKAQVLAMMGMLYGVPMSATTLFPVYPWDKKLRQMLQENGVDTNEGYTDVFMNGLVASTISGIMYAATGKDVQLDIGSRWGPSANQLLWNLMDTKRGETGFDELVQLLGGASGTIVSQIAGDMYPVITDIANTMATGGEGTHVLMADALNAGKNVSSYNALERAWQAYRTGVYKSKDGRVIDDKYEPFEAVFHMLTGIDSQSVSDTFLRFQSTAEEQAEEQKIMKEAKRWIRLYYGADSKEAREEYIAKINSVFVKGGFNHKQRIKAWQDTRKEDPLETTASDAFVTTPNDPAVQEARKKMIEE